MSRRKGLQRVVGRWVEAVVMLLLVFLFFALLTVLVFRIFPSGTTLTQLLEQGGGVSLGTGGGSRGAAVDIGGAGSPEQAAAVLFRAGNEVKSKVGTSIAWGPAREGMRLRDRDAVQTFTDSSAQINFDPANYLTMGSNSLIIIQRIEKEPATNLRRSAVVMVGGELQGRIGGAGAGRLRLRITTAAAEVRMLPGAASTAGSDFKVSVNPDRSSAIVVFRGAAEVSAQGKTVRVTQNSGVMVRPGEAPQRAIPLPAPPEPVSPPDAGVIRFRDLPPRVRLAWQGRVACRYRLQLACDPGFRQVVVDRRLDTAELVQGNLRKGIYFWRVSGIEGGIEGRPSRTLRFQVASGRGAPPLEVVFPVPPLPPDRFRLAGSTAPGNRVLVGGKPVAVDAAGGFSCEVPVREGMNLVTVEALDPEGNVTYRSQYVKGGLAP